MISLVLTLSFLATGVDQSPQQQQRAATFANDAATPNTADLIYRGNAASNTKCPMVVRAKPLKNLWIIAPQAIGNSCFAETSSTPPVIAQLGDATYYVLATALHYKLGPKHDEVVVPKGFVTDLASVPQALWSILPRDGQYMSAAILHDYMYWDQRCTKEEADTILKLEMAEFGVPRNVANDVYQGVHLLGSSAWESNRKTRLNSLRVIPDPYLQNFLESQFNAHQTWDELKKQMLAAGIRPSLDKGNPSVAEVCRRVAGL